MARPPTPVSACPLTRLELRDGLHTSVYEAGQFAGGMTLTLDGQPSPDAGGDALVLLVHCALREMVASAAARSVPGRRADGRRSSRSASRICCATPAP